MSAQMNNADGVMAVGVEGASNNFKVDCPAVAPARQPGRGAFRLSPSATTVRARQHARRQKLRDPETAPLIRKAVAIQVAAADASLSRGDLATLTILADYANDEGVAWPGMGTLAHETGISRRAVNDSIAQLIESGYIERTRRGGPGAGSNVYVLGRTPGGEVRFTSEDQFTSEARAGLVKSSAAPSEVQRVSLVNCASHESIHQPAQKQVDGEVDPPSAADAVGTAPAGAGLPSASGLRFKEFWQHYPRGEGRASADDFIGELIEGGQDLAAIVDGARRYAAHVKAAHVKPEHVKMPMGWLKDRRWLDSFHGDAMPAVDQQVRRKAASAPASATTAPLGTDGAHVSSIALGESPVALEDVEDENEWPPVAEHLEPARDETPAAFAQRLLEQADAFAIRLSAEAVDDDDREHAHGVGESAKVYRKMIEMLLAAGMTPPSNHAAGIAAVISQGNRNSLLTADRLREMMQGASCHMFNWLEPHAEELRNAVWTYTKIAREALKKAEIRALGFAKGRDHLAGWGNVPGKVTSKPWMKRGVRETEQERTRELVARTTARLRATQSARSPDQGSASDLFDSAINAFANFVDCVTDQGLFPMADHQEEILRLTRLASGGALITPDEFYPLLLGADCDEVGWPLFVEHVVTRSDWSSGRHPTIMAIFYGTTDSSVSDEVRA